MRRLVVIDGYNFIGATATLSGDRLEAERERLLDRLAGYAGARGNEVVVIFDGANHPVLPRPHPPRHGVRVFFSPPGTKADPWLVEVAKRSRGQCVVVSDDHGVSGPSARWGAVVLHCEDFARRLDEAARGAGDGGDELPAGPVPIPEPWTDGPAKPRAKAPPAAPARAPAARTRVTDDGLDAWEALTARVAPVQGRRAAAASGAAPGGTVAGPSDAEAWEAFLSGRYDPTRDIAAREDRAPAAPAPVPAASHAVVRAPEPPPDPAYLQALLEVPAGVAEAKDRDETAAERPEAGLTREARHRRNVLKDL